MKFVPYLLAGGLIAAAALAPLAGKRNAGVDYAQLFVDCSDRLGPARCAGYLDRWEATQPDARHEIKQRFAKDPAFAMHLIALTDAQILTGSVTRDDAASLPTREQIEQPFPGR